MPNRRDAIIVWMENMQGDELLIYSQMKHFLERGAWKECRSFGICLLLHAVQQFTKMQASETGVYGVC